MFSIVNGPSPNEMNYKGKHLYTLMDKWLPSLKDRCKTDLIDMS